MNIKLDCPTQFESKQNGFLHASKLKAVRHLTRQLSNVVSNNLPKTISPSNESSVLQQSVLNLIALALVGWRGLLPIVIKNESVQKFLHKLSKSGQLVEDQTTFANILTKNLFSSDFLDLASDGLFTDAYEVFKQPVVSSLLNDPLLLGWAWQILRRQLRTGLDQSIAKNDLGQNATAQNIASLTQWFTPHWIASFLVNETIDKFVKSSPSSAATLNFFDPACGAGHILIPALLRLVDPTMSGSKHQRLSALINVLQNQLFGCDIDPQMITFTSFAIYLTSRDIADVIELPLPHLFHFGWHVQQNSQMAPQAVASQIGSLYLGINPIPPHVQIFGLGGQVPLTDSPLARSFSAIVTNPPFLSHRFMSDQLSNFLQTNYKNGCLDVYAAFLSLCWRLLKEHGQMGIICQQSFMSTTRYRHLRKELLRNCQIHSLIQLGSGAFGPVSGEKINNAIIFAENNSNYSAQNSSRNSSIECWRILDSAAKLKAETNGIRSIPASMVNAAHFASIPGAPFSFWCPTNLRHLFNDFPQLESAETGIICVNGLFTCNNALFMKYHWQVNQPSSEWVPYDKGGGYKWYHTTPYLINWQENGQAIRQFRHKRGQSRALPGESYYFKKGITYSYIGTKGFQARLLSPNSIFDIASSAIFSQQIDLHYLLGFLNSSLARFFLGVLNPTINFQIGDLRRLPFAIPDTACTQTVIDATKKAIKLAMDIDTFNPISPRCETPILLRHALRSNDQYDLAKAYKQHCDYLKEISTIELGCQTKIDECIFDLYKTTKEDQKIILEDPWVSRTTHNFVTVPSFNHCLTNLKDFAKHK